jgi:hypothetical protein
MPGGDWHFINDHLGGWDDDGMPNFMSKSLFIRKILIT